MKLKNILTGSLAGVLLLGSLSACTDLTETGIRPNHVYQLLQYKG